MKEQELKKMELLITLNDNIVVQRFFNVRDYQEKAGRSLNLYNEVNNIKQIIQDDLKKKTLVYMTDNYFQITTDSLRPRLGGLPLPLGGERGTGCGVGAGPLWAYEQALRPPPMGHGD